MSKIYEALLRAEQDRTSVADESDVADQARDLSDKAPASPVDAPASALPASTLHSGLPGVRDSRPFPPAPLHPAGFPMDLAVATEAPQGVPSESSPSRPESSLRAADLEHIRRTVWTPSLQQLPALEERGSGVEQFRSLRSRMHEFRDLNTLKSILVASGLPQEGKSFIAANLAISFARHKASRVLLIDGDMRRCSLHKLLGCSCDPGLADYLAGRSTALEIMQRASTIESDSPLHPGLASLTFIGGGNDGDKAADLSGNNRFNTLIADVSPFFDWIVVDSSPVNLVADGVNLARACDAVLLVARGGVTRFETAQRALAELKASKVLGFVLNAVEKPPVSGGYYGYDSYNQAAD